MFSVNCTGAPFEPIFDEPLVTLRFNNGTSAGSIGTSLVLQDPTTAFDEEALYATEALNHGLVDCTTVPVLPNGLLVIVAGLGDTGVA